MSLAAAHVHSSLTLNVKLHWFFFFLQSHHISLYTMLFDAIVTIGCKMSLLQEHNYPVIVNCRQSLLQGHHNVIVYNDITRQLPLIQGQHLSLLQQHRHGKSPLQRHRTSSLQRQSTTSWKRHRKSPLQRHRTSSLQRQSTTSLKRYRMSSLQWHRASPLPRHRNCAGHRNNDTNRQVSLLQWSFDVIVTLTSEVIDTMTSYNIVSLSSEHTGFWDDVPLT